MLMHTFQCAYNHAIELWRYYNAATQRYVYDVVLTHNGVEVDAASSDTVQGALRTVILMAPRRAAT